MTLNLPLDWQSFCTASQLVLMLVKAPTMSGDWSVVVSESALLARLRSSASDETSTVWLIEGPASGRASSSTFMMTVWPALMVPSAHLMVFSKRSQPDGSTRSLSCWTRCGMSSTTTTPVASDGPALVMVFTQRNGV